MSGFLFATAFGGLLGGYIGDKSVLSSLYSQALLSVLPFVSHDMSAGFPCSLMVKAALQKEVSAAAFAVLSILLLSFLSRAFCISNLNL